VANVALWDEVKQHKKFWLVKLNERDFSQVCSNDVYKKTEQAGVNWIELAEVCCQYMNRLAEWPVGSCVTSPVTVS
jgi:hypothetical protein